MAGFEVLGAWLNSSPFGALPNSRLWLDGTCKTEKGPRNPRVLSLQTEKGVLYLIFRKRMRQIG